MGHRDICGESVGKISTYDNRYGVHFGGDGNVLELDSDGNATTW